MLWLSAPQTFRQFAEPFASFRKFSALEPAGLEADVQKGTHAVDEGVADLVDVMAFMTRQ